MDPTCLRFPCDLNKRKVISGPVPSTGGPLTLTNIPTLRQSSLTVRCSRPVSLRLSAAAAGASSFDSVRVLSAPSTHAAQMKEAASLKATRNDGSQMADTTRPTMDPLRYLLLKGRRIRLRLIYG